MVDVVDLGRYKNYYKPRLSTLPLDFKEFFRFKEPNAKWRKDCVLIPLKKLEVVPFPLFWKWECVCAIEQTLGTKRVFVKNLALSNLRCVTLPSVVSRIVAQVKKWIKFASSDNDRRKKKVSHSNRCDWLFTHRYIQTKMQLRWANKPSLNVQAIASYLWCKCKVY